VTPNIKKKKKTFPTPIFIDPLFYVISLTDLCNTVSLAMHTVYFLSVKVAVTVRTEPDAPHHAFTPAATDIVTYQ